MNQRNYGLKPDNRRIYEPPPSRPSVAAVLFGGVLLAALIASASALAYILHMVFSS